MNSNQDEPLVASEPNSEQSPEYVMTDNVLYRRVQADAITEEALKMLDRITIIDEATGGIFSYQMCQWAVSCAITLRHGMTLRPPDASYRDLPKPDDLKTILSQSPFGV